jgi:hypothetical protein
MSAVAKRRLEALSEHIVAPLGDQGNFENIPVLKKIGGDSVGPRVLGKVVIVTGTFRSGALLFGQLLIILQEPTPRLELVEHPLINLHTTEPKPFISAILMTQISRPTRENLHRYTPRLRSMFASSMLQTRNR